MKNKHFGKINLHIHTYYSDGIYSPKKIVKEAKKMGFFAIAITDHNEIKGSLKALKYQQRYGVTVIPGIELYFSVNGHLYELLALFETGEKLQSFYKEFRYRNYFIPSYPSVKDVDRLIQSHAGIAIAAHPFGRKGIYRDKKGMIIPDISIEVINAFTGKYRNRKAKRNCDEGLCHEFGAADLHSSLSSMDFAYTQIRSQEEFSPQKLWENLSLKQRTIEFIPKGKCYMPQRIIFQKFLCVVKMFEYLPRQFIGFLIKKGRIQKLRELKQENC